MSKFVSLNNVQKELNTLREEGIRSGVRLGFSVFRERLTLKKGYPVFIAGAPHEGKTEFYLELLMQTSEIYGWRHLVYTGETGSAEEIYAELCYKYIGKPFNKLRADGRENPYAMTDDERMEAEVWVAHHFTIIDTEHDLCKFENFDLYNFYKNVDDIESQLDYSFDTVGIDPYNDLDEDYTKVGGRQDLYLKDSLKFCRQNARINNRVNFIINHISDIKPMVDPSTKKRYYPPALPNEWYGGKIWHRRGFLNILVYRPPEFLNDPETGEPYAQNQTIIQVQKAKPKGIAKMGTMSIYWDWKRNRYYELDGVGIAHYARKELGKFRNPETGEMQDTKPIPSNEDFDKDGIPW